MGKARDFIPALKFGHKIIAEDLAGIVGQPVVGNIWYVDAVNGSDTANSGTSWDDAFKTLTKAEDSAVSNNYDVIIIAPGGSTATTEVASITWDKNHITVFGACAPVGISQRARVLFSSAVISPCMTISGYGNRFMNIQIGTYEDINVLISLTGDRNYFGNVHFAGMGNATTGDDAAGRIISMSGAEENLFEDCTIGLDTVARSTTNASVELASASNRNIFRNCRFLAFADNAGALFVKAASAADIDRFVLFDHCIFHNAANSSASTMTTAMSTHAAVGGSVILHDCWLFGATDWSTDFTAIEAAGSMVQATGNTAGLMVAAA